MLPSLNPIFLIETTVSLNTFISINDVQDNCHVIAQIDCFSMGTLSLWVSSKKSSIVWHYLSPPWRGGVRLEKLGSKRLTIPKWYFPVDAFMSCKVSNNCPLCANSNPSTTSCGELSCYVVIYLFISELLGGRIVTVTAVTLVSRPKPWKIWI